MDAEASSKSALSIIPLVDTCPPGMTARITAKPNSGITFRPERLYISPQSFPLSFARRVWTWPFVLIGSVLLRVCRGLAKLLRVDLYASHERREYVSVDHEGTHGDIPAWDDEIKCYFILIPTPLNVRERLLGLLKRTATRFWRIRTSWQLAQLSTLFVCNITISNKSQFVDGGGPLPADLFATSAIGGYVNLGTCMAGHEIQIEVYNGNRRKCHLTMGLIGRID